jgi:sugar lactone lactonase YvrE
VKRSIALTLLALLAGLLAYLLAWPVPISPVAWQAPPNPGYGGPFAPNARLNNIETLALGGDYGPEEVVLDSQGRIYAATHDGWIVRLEPDGSRPTRWVDTGGRPLGLDFDAQGRLIVADAFRGLLAIDTQGRLQVLATTADSLPIRYANNVAVAADGRIYFSDASTQFGAEASGGTYPASLLDILEHGGHGRLLVYDPATRQTTTLLDGLHFANGVAVSPDQSHVLVVETGAYRILRVWLTRAKAGLAEPLLEALPGFPDNLTRGREGRYWVALISPRNALLDRLADKPRLRKVMQRLPAFVRPQAVSYGHIVAFNSDGEVVADLQAPDGAYPLITSVTETADYLYLGSLVAPAIGRLAGIGAAGRDAYSEKAK